MIQYSGPRVMWPLCWAIPPCYETAKVWCWVSRFCVKIPLMRNHPSCVTASAWQKGWSRKRGTTVQYEQYNRLQCSRPIVCNTIWYSTRRYSTVQSVPAPCCILYNKISTGNYLVTSIDVCTSLAERTIEGISRTDGSSGWYCTPRLG